MTGEIRVLWLLRALRPGRVVIDVSLLIAALVLFTAIQPLTAIQSSNAVRQAQQLRAVKQPRPQVADDAKTAFVVQHHDTESAMWIAFSSLQHELAKGSGSCRFSAPHPPALATYELMCIGRNTQKAQEVPRLISSELPQTTPENSQLHHVFAIMPKARSTPPDHEAPEPTIVRGWMDTPSGRKQFDAARNRWTP